jgi:hypothetical protein
MNRAYMLALLSALAAGCITRPQNPAATQPATVVDAATTQPSYWLDQPASASASASDFERLFVAAEDALRELQFRIDRIDYRAGLLTTRPMVSKQFFELWRADAQTWDDVTESSIATIRRTVRIDFTRTEDGFYHATPRVLIERQTLAEQRITSAVSYRRVFSGEINPQRRARGTRESDVGIALPSRYWTPTGRDAALEQMLARSVQQRVDRSGRG